MSDKTYWVNKNVKRQMDKSDIVAFEHSVAGNWVSTVMMIGMVLAVFGLMQYFMNKQEYGLYMGIAGAVVFIGFLIFNALGSNLTFTEYVFEFEGKELVFQYIGKKHIYFACDDVIVEFVDRKANDAEYTYKPHRSFKKMLETVYPDKIKKNDGVIYVGKSVHVVNGKEKNVTYKIKLDSKNKMEWYSVDGAQFKSYFIEKGKHKLAMPICMYNQIKKHGIALPDDTVITLVYEY